MPITTDALAIGPAADTNGATVAVSPIKRFIQKTVSVDLPSCNTITTTNSNNITFTGAQVGDLVLVSIPSGLNAGLGVASAYVSAADTVIIRIINTTAGALDPAAANFVITVIGV